MKRTKKIILYSLAVILLGIGGFATYIYFKKSPDRAVWNYIPKDAIYIIETENLTKGWSTLSDSKIWQHMIKNKMFDDLRESANTLDSLIKGNETLDYLFTDRRLLISAHPLEKGDFDFLFLVDLKQAGKLAFIQDYIEDIAGQFKLKVTKEDFEGQKILIVQQMSEGDTFYLSIIDNIFMASYSKKIIQNSIKTSQTPGEWKNNKQFQEVARNIQSKNLFNFYICYDYFAPYLKLYTSDNDDLLKELRRIFDYSAFNINLENEEISFKGKTILADSANSYLHLLSTIDPGPMQAHNVIPSNVALYLSLTFNNYNDLFQKLKSEFSFQDSANAENYEKNLRRVEKYFSIDLETDFFGWFGNEIALVKLPPTPNARENDMAVVIHASDIEKAKEGLDKILKKVKRRSPVKFEDTEYNNFTIQYLGIKGFFKMFFGKMFAKIDKPYFVIIDNFVIFSNSPSYLMDIIDEYNKGRVLAKDKAFTDFKEEWESDANVTIYIQGPLAYSHLYFFAPQRQKSGMQANRDLIGSFNQIAFQLISRDKNFFENNLFVKHNPDAVFDSDLELVENAAENIYIAEFDSLLALEPCKDMEDGKTCQVLYPGEDLTVKAEGRMNNDKQDGIWRFYYISGKLWGTIMFDKGTASGKAFLYFDDEDGTIKAQCEFEDGKINGIYREFYKNGERKAQIEYSEGKPDGEATFYYESGSLKIEGEYKEGDKTGKWKHYTETGDLMDKEKMKRKKRNN